MLSSLSTALFKYRNYSFSRIQASAPYAVEWHAMRYACGISEFKREAVAIGKFYFTPWHL